MSDSGARSTRSAPAIAEAATSESWPKLAIRIEPADEDDPLVLERLVRALADVLTGQVG